MQPGSFCGADTKQMKLRCVIVATLFMPLLTHAEKDNGAALFEQHCASCHGNQTDGRVPTRVNLSFMNPLALLAAMESGSMRVQASALTADQKRALAEGITRKNLADLTIPQPAFCQTDHAPVDQNSTLYWSGWGGDEHGSGHARLPLAGLTRKDLASLRLAWAFAFPGASQARSQPAVLDDVVYVGGAEGSVTALDAFTGCIYWRVDTTSAVRGAMVVAKIDERYAVLAVARSTEVYAIDAATGKIIWRTRAGFHPLHSVTGTPALHHGRLFIPISSVEVGVARMPSHTCCTSSGGVVAVELKTGKTLWQMRATLRPAEKVGVSAGKPVFAPSGAPVWASPTIDAKRNLVYVGTGENYSRPATLTSDAILALDMDTGELVWSFQGTPDDAWHGGCARMPDYAPCDDPGPDFDFGMSPILLRLPGGKDVLYAGQKSAVVYALDPDTQGALLWQTRVGKGSALGGIHWGMATDGKQLYVPNGDRPAIIKDVNPDVPLSPGMYALDLATGKINWRTPTPGPNCTPDPSLNQRELRTALGRCITANSAAPTVSGDVVFAGDLYGHLRGYDITTGEIIWSYDTDQTFDAVNLVPAKGGSIDGPGPVIANGRLYVNSGYGSFGQKPGNVLLSFAVADDAAH